MHLNLKTLTSLNYKWFITLSANAQSSARNGYSDFFHDGKQEMKQIDLLMESEMRILKINRKAGTEHGSAKIL